MHTLLFKEAEYLYDCLEYNKDAVLTILRKGKLENIVTTGPSIQWVGRTEEDNGKRCWTV
jgi:hypothetical protein